MSKKRTHPRENIAIFSRGGHFFAFFPHVFLCFSKKCKNSQNSQFFIFFDIFWNYHFSPKKQKLRNDKKNDKET